MADPPRRAADHGAVRGRAGAGVTPDAGTPSTASTPAQRQDCLEQADQWKYECETRGDMVWKVAKYVAFGSGNFPVGVGLDVFCPSAYKAACRFDWKRDKAACRFDWKRDK